MHALTDIVKTHATPLKTAVNNKTATWSDVYWIMHPDKLYRKTRPTWTGFDTGKLYPVIDFSVSGYEELKRANVYGILRRSVDRYKGRPAPKPGERPHWNAHDWTWLIDFVYPVEGEFRPYQNPISYYEHSHKYIDGEVFGMSAINFHNIWKGCLLSFDSPESHESFLHEFELALAERKEEERFLEIEKQILTHTR